MKNGKPSLIYDIRYFTDMTTYLEGHHDVTAFGRRLAWLLNAEGVSLGAYHSLYICFSNKMEKGTLKVTDEGFAWWQRYAYVGVPEKFPDISNASEIAMKSTEDVLKKISPAYSEQISYAYNVVRQHGEDLRFLIKSKSFKNFIVNISITIEEHPKPSKLHISLIDRKNGKTQESEPVLLKIYNVGFDLAGVIKLNEHEVTVLPRTGVTAQVLSRQHNGPITRSLSSFYQESGNFLLSKLVQPAI